MATETTDTSRPTYCDHSVPGTSITGCDAYEEQRSLACVHMCGVYKTAGIIETRLWWWTENELFVASDYILDW